MLQLCMLGSGSKGNAVYLESSNSRLLIDAGLTAREIVRRMSLIGRSPQDLDAILVSHEHSDHIRGVGVLARKWDIRVHIADPTLTSAAENLGPLPKVTLFEPGCPFTINDLVIRPFEVTHDAANPVNFIIDNHSIRIGIATDLGYASTVVRENLKECRVLILEANHDPEMLEQGPYPWPLKQRIRSKYGHLSNEECAGLLGAVWHRDLRQVCLAHLSETNNNPETALSTVRRIMGEYLDNLKLWVADQHRVGPVIRV
jgi:phosphoribosyl 1,2-cyclic phosphodiesterase